jgi:hypothetical protein
VTFPVPRFTEPSDEAPKGWTIDPFTGKPRPKETRGGPRRPSGTIMRTDGKPACIDCGRPVQRTRGRRDKRPQSRCNGCHAKYERNRRAGKIQMLVTPGEREAILAARAAGWPIGGAIALEPEAS